jgi:hypothetical protein
MALGWTAMSVKGFIINKIRRSCNECNRSHKLISQVEINGGYDDGDEEGEFADVWDGRGIKLMVFSIKYSRE